MRIIFCMTNNYYMYSVLQCIETWRVIVFRIHFTTVDVPFSAIVLAVPCWKIMLLLMMCFSHDIFYIGVEESIWSCRPWTDNCLIFCFVSLVLSWFLFYISAVRSHVRLGIVLKICLVFLEKDEPGSHTWLNMFWNWTPYRARQDIFEYLSTDYYIYKSGRKKLCIIR
jgi:hypothetical protein